MDLLFAFLVAYAVVGALDRMWEDFKAAVRMATRAARSSVTARTAARWQSAKAAPWTSPAKWGWLTGVLVARSAVTGWGVTKGVSKGAVATGRSGARGWQDGWAKGRAAYQARVTAVPPAPVTWTPDRSVTGDRPVTTDVTGQVTDRSPDTTGHPEPVTEDTPSTPVDNPVDNVTSSTTTKEDDMAGANGSSSAKGRTGSGGDADGSTLESLRGGLAGIAKIAEDAMAAVEKILADLAAVKIDEKTKQEVSAIYEAFESAKELAGKAVSGADDRHSAIEEAVTSAPGVAEMEFYGKTPGGR
jgi:hypothetical protein